MEDGAEDIGAYDIITVDAVNKASIVGKKSIYGCDERIENRSAFDLFVCFGLLTISSTSIILGLSGSSGDMRLSMVRKSRGGRISRNPLNRLGAIRSSRNPTRVTCLPDWYLIRQILMISRIALFRISLEHPRVWCNHVILSVLLKTGENLLKGPHSGIWAFEVV